jgi:putative adenylate-forming enzyme
MTKARTYLAALWRSRPRSRHGLERHQQRLWRRFQRDFDDYPALRAYRHAAFEDLPVIDVTDYRARFHAYNRHELSGDEAAQAALASEGGGDAILPHGLRAGFSTGTSGAQRGLFVTSAAERVAYTGQILAKLLSPFELLRIRRVAVCLRAPNALYSAGRIDLRFFPLAADSAQQIAGFSPDLVIAPSQVLLAMARNGCVPSLRRLFYGAETLNGVERAFVTDRLGVRPDPIYQATEGFLGAPCRLGSLHLNEDSLIFEPEALAGGRFRPIVTDLLRRTQAVVRLRLDDILEVTSCTCGSPLTAVLPVEGRLQDVWQWPKPIFPREVETLLSPLIPADHPWIAEGRSESIRLACRDEDFAVLGNALQVFGRPVVREIYRPEMDYPKRRHVRWAP